MIVMAKQPGGNIMPAMRYRNAPAAIEWLCKAFGFERHVVVPGDGGTIAHAQLVLGNGMIMLGSGHDDEWAQHVKPTSDLSGPRTASVYVVVEDADAHYARAVAAGAKIIQEIKDNDYGGRSYGCRDLEGHVWTFGTYDPWREG